MKQFVLESLSFSFTQGKYFFKDMSCEVDESGLIFLIGKNGAGKSTLFRLLQGLTESHEHVQGRLQVSGVSYDISQAKDRDVLKNKSMLLHQNFDHMLVPSFTGLENLSFAKFLNYPRLVQATIVKQVTQLAQQFAIPLDRPVGLLSGGQRQMLALLMTVQKDIDLLLLDEPTSALDVENSSYMMQGIKQLARERGISIICISHDQELIDLYAQHILEIAVTDQGKREIITVK